MSDPSAEYVTLSPEAVEARQIMHRSNWFFGVGMALLMIVSTAGAYFAVSGRAASRDSFTASAAQFANSQRNACLTQRSAAEQKALGTEMSAIGDMQAAYNRALKAALVDDDDGEAYQQIRKALNADARRQVAQRQREAAAKSRQEDVLNQPPPIGCGPPITNADQLDGTTTTTR